MINSHLLYQLSYRGTMHFRRNFYNYCAEFAAYFSLNDPFASLRSRLCGALFYNFKKDCQPLKLHLRQ